MPGNLLICWAVVRDPLRELKSPFNYFVFNLSLADLIVGAVTEPVFVGYHVAEALRHPVLGFRWLAYLSYFMTSTASLLGIAALAFDRYLTVTSSYRRRLALRRVVTISVGIWIVILTVPFTYLVAGFYKLAFVFANTAMTFTLGVLIFSFVKIHQSLRSHQVAQERNQSGSGRTACWERRSAMAFERKATQSFFWILLFFIICTVPSCVMIYVINLCDDTCDCNMIHWFRDLQYLVVLINSAANQFLYALRQRSFTRAIGKLINRRWPFISGSIQAGSGTALTIQLNASVISNNTPIRANHVQPSSTRSTGKNNNTD